MKLVVLFVELLERFFPGIVNSEMKIMLLKRKGVNVGRGTFIFDAGHVNIDTSRPALLSIGEYCKITGGVTILTHDYSRSVIRRVYGEVVGEARKTIIGNNVFIGMNSIILMGTYIGDNCIIGAGSVCHGKYPENSVVAGNPAKVICSLEDYYEKRKSRSFEEAIGYVKLYKERYGENPSIKEMGAFFPLYLERTREALEINEIRVNLSGDEKDEVIDAFLKSEPLFDSYDSFLDSIEKIV